MTSDLETFALSPALVERLLDDVIYDRLAKLVNLDAIAALEHVLAEDIESVGNTTQPRAVALARQYVDRAWERLSDARRSYCDLVTGELELCASCAATDERASET